MGLAPGLWLLVSKWRAVPAAHERFHCGRSGDEAEWLPAGIKRSHKLGRIEHVLTGEQAGADRAQS